ncbi:unnamed protein product [Ceratitis capitata]|uniref:(Mediterranean fruit fly) hypothetical protein n=1 Tax=Ceratitis capitata TaxID=7213 RepID=A0A811U2S5_CERCA|nr:unnamed protein product [Ceratitis capitata]
MLANSTGGRFFRPGQGGAHTKSQFPVFTPCARAWCVDREKGYKLNGYAKRAIPMVCDVIVWTYVWKKTNEHAGPQSLHKTINKAFCHMLRECKCKYTKKRLANFYRCVKS